MKRTIRTHGGRIAVFLCLCAALMLALCVTAAAASDTECPGYGDHQLTSTPIPDGKEHYYICVHCRERVTELHNYTNWESNGKGVHIGTCACGATTALPCSGGEANCTSPAICAICYAPYGEIASDHHEYGEVWISGKTTHYYACLHCGVRKDENPHTYSKPVSNEDGTHTRICDCGKILTERCTGGTATCTEPAVCDACETGYGELNGQNHSYSTEWKQDKLTHYHICDRCGEKADEAEHTYRDWISTEDGNHTGTCECGKTHAEACSGGTANCIELAVCDLCQEPYGEADPEAHVYPDDEWLYDPTGHWAICATCGEKSERALHEWGDDRYCVDCGATETNYVTVTVQNGHLFNSEMNVTVIELFSAVTVVANEPEMGMMFVGWEANGKPVGEHTQLTFYATLDTSLCAVFEEDPNYIPPPPETDPPETVPTPEPESKPAPLPETDPETETNPVDLSVPIDEDLPPLQQEFDDPTDDGNDIIAIILGAVSVFVLVAMGGVLLYRKKFA